jgi:four helix bundle protein
MYRTLTVWKKSYALGLAVYRATRQFPKEELYGITSQMRRAATSIAVNIAEGNARNSTKEYKQFISIARGSASELETWLMFSKDLNILDELNYQELQSQIDEIKKMLFALHKSLNP